MNIANDLIGHMKQVNHRSNRIRLILQCLIFIYFQNAVDFKTLDIGSLQFMLCAQICIASLFFLFSAPACTLGCLLIWETVFWH